MGLADHDVLSDQGIGWKRAVVTKESVPISQTDAEIGAFRPGKRFFVEEVQVYCSAVAATATVNVKVAGTTILTGQVTPVAGSIVFGTLVSAVATQKGGATDEITVEVTTNGTGTITDLRVDARYRFIAAPE